MHYVYLIKSIKHLGKTYIGSTGDLRRRLAEHNAGKSRHTSISRPWRLVAYIAVPDKLSAERFERYLKSGSGRAFAQRHFRG